MSTLILTEVTNYTLPDFIEKGENVVALGTFDDIQQVNRFIQTHKVYPPKLRFIQEAQNIYFTDEDGTPVLLRLERVKHNPQNKVGEVWSAFDDEPTIENLLTDDSHQKSFVEHKKLGYSCKPYRWGTHSMCIQFWGWAIVLHEDGTWHWEATDGG